MCLARNELAIRRTLPGVHPRRDHLSPGDDRAAGLLGGVGAERARVQTCTVGARALGSYSRPTSTWTRGSNRWGLLLDGGFAAVPLRHFRATLLTAAARASDQVMWRAALRKAVVVRLSAADRRTAQAVCDPARRGGSSSGYAPSRARSPTAGDWQTLHHMELPYHARYLDLFAGAGACAQRQPEGRLSLAAVSRRQDTSSRC
jgi:hypothetical protein